MNESYIDIALYAGYALVVLCTVLAFVLPLINAVSNPASLIKPVAGLILLVVVIFIGYAIADNTAMGDATQEVSKWVGGILITMYVLVIVAIVGIIYTEISKVIK